MKIMRQEWINEGKPRQRSPEVENQRERDENNVFPTENAADLPMIPTSDGMDHDKADVPQSVRSKKPTREGNDTLFMTDDEAEDETMQPPEDELDALMAEVEGATKYGSVQPLQKATTPHTAMREKDDDFADEEEAMAGFADMW